MGKTLDDFRREHDPAYVIQSPTQVYGRELPKGTKRYIVTSAQNATPVCPEFWAVLLAMAGRLQAEILVVPLRYKNPTSQWGGSQRNAEHWAAEVRPYLWNQRHDLHPDLTLLADIKIQPTASSPLTGAEGISHGASAIIGHPKLQLRTVAAPQAQGAKILTTTGMVTLANFSDSRAGVLGAFHHSLSAVLVELDGKAFHLRHLHFDSKRDSVVDLTTEHTARSAKPAPRPLALVMGDTHVDAVDPVVERALFGPKGMVAELNPAHLVYHDLLDGESVNPHTSGNPFAAVARLARGTDDASAEVQRAIKFVLDRLDGERKAVIVPSNHNDFLQRWLLTDWRQDPKNAEMYLETALAFVRSARGGAEPERFDAFAHWMRKAAGDRKDLVILARDESFTLGGVELGMHGDRGPNGARGSARNLSRIGVKSVIGHSHSPHIEEGAYQVGTSSRLRLGYNIGPSSWMHTMCLILASGKRCLINVTDGRWRA
jgi:hypothetical protein